jgi:hypothetical protein
LYFLKTAHRILRSKEKEQTTPFELVAWKLPFSEPFFGSVLESRPNQNYFLDFWDPRGRAIATGIDDADFHILSGRRLEVKSQQIIGTEATGRFVLATMT